MRKRTRSESENKLYVDVLTLAGMLETGRVTADKIGIAAEAKVKIGRSSRYNIEKVKAYMESLTVWKE